MHFSLKLLTINKAKKKKAQVLFSVFHASCITAFKCFLFILYRGLLFSNYTLPFNSSNSRYSLNIQVLFQRSMSFKPRHFSWQYPTEGVAFRGGGGTGKGEERERETVRASTLQN